MDGHEIAGSTAEITWESQIPVTLKIRYGTDELDQEKDFDQPDTVHGMVLDNLEPNTVYGFCVTSTDVSGTVYPENCDEFRTAR